LPLVPSGIFFPAQYWFPFTNYPSRCTRCDYALRRNPFRRKSTKVNLGRACHTRSPARPPVRVHGAMERGQSGQFRPSSSPEAFRFFLVLDENEAGCRPDRRPKHMKFGPVLQSGRRKGWVARVRKHRGVTESPARVKSRMVAVAGACFSSRTNLYRLGAAARRPFHFCARADRLAKSGHWPRRPQTAISLLAAAGHQPGTDGAH
jgi:hypothetical protein